MHEMPEQLTSIKGQNRQQVQQGPENIHIYHKLAQNFSIGIFWNNIQIKQHPEDGSQYQPKEGPAQGNNNTLLAIEVPVGHRHPTHAMQENLGSTTVFPVSKGMPQLVNQNRNQNKQVFKSY